MKFQEILASAPARLVPDAKPATPARTLFPGLFLAGPTGSPGPGPGPGPAGPGP